MRRGMVLILILFSLMACASPLGARMCPGQSEQFVEDSEAILEEWTDASALAASTPRVSLPEVISDLQAIKRRANDLEAPDCAASIKIAMVNGMESAITALLGFAADSPQIVIDTALAESVASFDEVTFRLARLRAGEDVNAPLPTVTPTYTPLPTRTPGPTRTPAPTHTPAPTRTPKPTVVTADVGVGTFIATVKLPATLETYFVNGPDTVPVYAEPNGTLLDCELPVGTPVRAVAVDKTTGFVEVSATSCNGWLNSRNLRRIQR
jgi:hypothetical protein